jgi:FkbM family methyltransferase
MARYLVESEDISNFEPSFLFISKKFFVRRMEQTLLIEPSNMLTKIFRLPFTIVAVAREAASSPYAHFADRWEIFTTLLALRIKYALNKNPKQPVSQNMFGYTVWGYSYDVLLYLYREIFLMKSYYFESDNNNPVILDCGANIGMAVLYFKKLFPNAKIVAFEPNPSAFELLSKNVKENGLKDVTLVNAGLSHTSGRLQFFTGESKASLVGSIRQDRAEGNSVEVDITLLSNYIKQHNADVIKMDVEGAEWMIMEDLVKSDTLHIPEQYLMEYHHQINHERARFSTFLSMFEQRGFDYNLRAEYTETGSFQDVVLHFYKRK